MRRDESGVIKSEELETDGRFGGMGRCVPNKPKGKEQGRALS